MHIVDCTHAAHADAILAILNDAIVTSTALYDYVPRPPEAMATWFANKEKGGFPVIGAVADDGTLLGFASYGTFRAFPAYKYTVEHAIYVHKDHRRHGLARTLLEHLIERARRQDVHCIVGAIDMDNRGSIALHESMGFVHAGTIRQAGFKFGRWLDVGFYQRLLETPLDPRDG